MSTIAHNPSERVTIGVDTHQDQHVAVAINGDGAYLGEHRIETTLKGYADLESWSASFGSIAAFGVGADCVRSDWLPDHDLAA